MIELVMGEFGGLFSTRTMFLTSTVSGFNVVADIYDVR